MRTEDVGKPFWGSVEKNKALRSKQKSLQLLHDGEREREREREKEREREREKEREREMQ